MWSDHCDTRHTGRACDAAEYGTFPNDLPLTVDWKSHCSKTPGQCAKDATGGFTRFDIFHKVVVQPNKSCRETGRFIH